MTHRVGLIIPASNRVVEDEMARFYPDGVRVHVNRLRMTGEHKVPLGKLKPRITDATGALADARCESVTFHCTANSTGEGDDGEALILDAMKPAGAKHVSTTATALRRALKALGSTRMVLLTPYTQKVTDHEAEFIEAAGVKVLTAVGLGMKDSDAFCAATPASWRDKTLELRNEKADLYFISCANTMTFTIIDELEKALEQPVITSNQVVVWDQMKALGIDARGRCPGQLMRH